MDIKEVVKRKRQFFRDVMAKSYLEFPCIQQWNQAAVIQNTGPLTKMSIFVNEQFTRNIYRSILFMHSISDFSSLEDNDLRQNPNLLLCIAFSKFGTLSANYLDIQFNNKPVWLSVFHSVNINNFVTFTCEIISQNSNENKGFIDKESLFCCLTANANPGVKLLCMYLIFQCHLHCLIRSNVYPAASFAVCSPRIIFMLSYLLLCKLDNVKEITEILYKHDRTFLRSVIFEVVSYCLVENADIRVSPTFIESHNSCSVKPKTFARNILTTEKQREGDIHCYAYSTCTEAAKNQYSDSIGPFCYRELATLGQENCFKHFNPNFDPNESIANFLKKC